jgi:hypothetical protein
MAGMFYAIHTDYEMKKRASAEELVMYEQNWHSK